MEDRRRQMLRGVPLDHLTDIPFRKVDTPCVLCGRTVNTFYNIRSAAKCDWCWELEKRIERDPELAKRILAQINMTTP